MDATTSTDTAAAPVAHLDDLVEGSLKMVKVDGHRVCLIRTSTGVHAIDHACPHEGYGLTQGDLNGDLLTCAWHNWKFRVSDGECVLGEEGVRSHSVDIDESGAIRIELDRPDPAELRPRLFASLRSAIQKDYMGQASRDVIRLLHADANPGELIYEAVAHGAPRGEFGWGHSIASATDCLAMMHLYEGDQRALPIVQGIAGIAEMNRDRPARNLPDPAESADATRSHFREAVEAEQLERAQALVLAAIERGDGAAELRPWFTDAVSDHLLSYGHGAIYSQKAFELLEMIGWERAHTVLPHLVPGIVYGTREDTLPYMRPYMKALGGSDLSALAAVEPDASWSDDGALATALLGSDRGASVAAAVSALQSGAGVDGLLDAVVTAVSERMLRYDVAGERDFDDDFGWLDITHGMTYANAARWLHTAVLSNGAETTPDHIRLALFTAFLANWTGRHEWHTTVGQRDSVEPLADTITGYGDVLQRQSMLDGTTAFIVHAHAVKTSRAASIEAERLGALPLDATARFMAAPKLERFVAATVHRSIEFLNGRTQRD